jgi:hypothetical protein
LVWFSGLVLPFVVLSWFCIMKSSEALRACDPTLVRALGSKRLVRETLTAPAEVCLWKPAFGSGDFDCFSCGVFMEAPALGSEVFDCKSCGVFMEAPACGSEVFDCSSCGVFMQARAFCLF